MDEKLLRETYKEYLNKREEILRVHGENDGFIISGTPWWEFYDDLINQVLTKYEAGILTENELVDFYAKFGFGVKLYGMSFVEKGVDPIIGTFKFLEDKRISAEKKLSETVENPDSPYNLRGIGINFVTLFLTVRFPKEYAQWNGPITDALKILKAHPEKPWGMKKSTFYKEINNSILLISRKIEEPFLPRLDNYLFSLAQGYVGEEKTLIDIVDDEVRELEEDTERVKPSKKYLAVQYQLIMTGKLLGYDVWVASNDREESYKGTKFASLTLNSLPSFGSPRAISMSKWIDVIWFEKGSNKPVRFFEIEHSTSVYSGLLRLNDVFIDYPIPKATIVVPRERMKKVDSEVSRPTFQALSDVCDFLSYDDVKEWFEATEKIDKYR